MKTMKFFNIRAIVIIAVMAIACPGVFAQDQAATGGAVADFKKHEFRVGAGYLSSNDLINTYSDLMSTALSGDYSVDNDKYYGNYSLTYRYWICKHFAVGGSFTYSLLKSDVKLGGDKGKSENNYFTIAPEAEYRYIDGRIFKMYGFVGAGLTVNRQKLTMPGDSSTDKGYYFNFQVSPLGFQVGENFGAYLEGGFGYKGVVNLGLFAKF